MNFPSFNLLAQAVLSGIFMGGLYGLIGLGLGLTWGLLRQINLSHFGLVFVSAYLSYHLVTVGHIETLLPLTDEELIEIVGLGDCFANVMLLEYAKRNRRKRIAAAVTKCAKNLLSAESREIDKHWLLVYQVWSVSQLDGNGQGFLARLKEKGFEFFSAPKPRSEKLTTEDVPEANFSMVWSEYF